MSLTSTIFEEMLIDPSFYDSKASPKSLIYEFRLIGADDLWEQNNGSIYIIIPFFNKK